MLEKLKDIMQAIDFFLTKKNEIAKQLYTNHVLKRKRQIFLLEEPFPPIQEWLYAFIPETL